MAGTTGAGGAGSTGAEASQAAAGPIPIIALDIKWLGAIGMLWFVLVALASLESSRDLAVALAWLIAIGALLFLFDPNGTNLLEKVIQR